VRLLGRKGTSEVIAAMLMIVITVAAAVLLYVYSSGLMGRIEGSAVQQRYANQIILEYYNWPSSNLNNLTLYLRNTGSGQGLLSDFLINGNAAALTKGSCTTYTTNALKPGSACTAVLTLSGTITAGYSYPLQLVTKDGSVFSYSLIAGQSGAPV